MCGGRYQEVGRPYHFGQGAFLRGEARVKWCDKGEDHKPPFNTVQVIAIQVGEGTGARKGKRLVRRVTVSRLCDECLLEAEFSFSGRTLFRLEALDRASG